MKKRIIFISFFFFSLMLNIIPLFICREKITFDKYSYFPIFMMISWGILAICAYIFRHKGNIIIPASPKLVALFNEPLEKGYYQRFFKEFTFYCSCFPFYINLIFFGSIFSRVFVTMFFIFIPWAIIALFRFIILAKEAKIAQAKKDKELKEQQKREELGYFK